MTKTNRKILLIIMGISLFCDLLIVGLFLSVAARPWPETPIDYEDPESLWQLAQRTEQYIIRANPDKDSPARKEALQALEDIAALEVSYDEKARLIHERFPEESFWTDDVKEVLKQAEAGDAEAQFLLGCFYSEKKRVRSSDSDPERGRCVIKSRPLAAKWFRKAAEQGHPQAQYNLGIYYKEGRGVAKDEAEAEKWFRMAEETNARFQK
jgi:TPR repeat protein